MPTDKAPDKGKDAPVDMELLRQLAELLNETGLTEIEIERGDLRVKIGRGVSITDVQSIPALPAAPQPAMLGGPAAAPAAAPPAAPLGEVVKSPMVGTVYMQSTPGSEPFIRVGAEVAAGQTLMIVEAMKTMNPVPAPRAGRVLEILVGDSQPVEFGEPLVVLE